MRRARFEGRRIGREPLNVDRYALVRDRDRGMSLTELAKAYCISRASVCRVLKKTALSAPLIKVEDSKNLVT